MKAVIYHADSHFPWSNDILELPGLYERLFRKFREIAHKYDMQVVHLTLPDFPGYGDENYYYPGLDPKNVMFNREECFTRFLSDAEDMVYWFAEPDYRIEKMWPPLKADMAICYRPNDNVPLCPAWRLGTKRALPIFQRVLDIYKGLQPSPGVGFDWHGDSWAWTTLWHEMGKPTKRVNHLGVDIEFRDFADYLKPKNTYGRNHFGRSKREIV